MARGPARRTCKGCHELRSESSFVHYEYSHTKKMRTARVHGHCEVCRAAAVRLRNRRDYIARKEREYFEGVSRA